jgi:hypothetical protein
LRLLECEEPPVVPRNLTECDERNRMPPEEASVGFPGFTNMLHKAFIKQSRWWLGWLESDHPAKDFAAVVAGHSHGCNLRDTLIYIEHGRAANIDATISKEDAALRKFRKAREEILPDKNLFMRLPADFGYALGDEQILARVIHSSKCITRNGARRGLPPRHHDAGIQSPGEGYTDALISREITGQDVRKDVSKFLVVRFRL